MIEIVDVPEGPRIDDYAAYAFLSPSVEGLVREARVASERLAGRTVWMVSSTKEGGGVAEGLPRLVSLLRQLGVATEWAVIGSDEERFFALTKRVHNMLHGSGDPSLDDDDRALFERIGTEVAAELRPRLQPDDVLVIHDPQPLAVGAALKRDLGLPLVWRCHVGLEERNAAADAAWEFLETYACQADRAAFSLPDYVPPFLADRATILPPSIDPLSHKNRELDTHKLTGVLIDAALAPELHPALTPPFAALAERLQADGSFAPATEPEDLGLLFRPVITQVSRWDRLKGFLPLLEGFARMKRDAAALTLGSDGDDRRRRRLDLVRLVLAGPAPGSVQDDPEAAGVLEEITAAWQALEPALRRDIAVLRLPMRSRRDNALMVNALQRCSSIVAQVSLREGFGLTATEAMWKGVPALVSGTAAGLRAQVEDGEHGRVLRDPTDADEVAHTLAAMLADDHGRDRWGRNARHRVTRETLIFTELRRWLDLLAGVAGGGARS